MNKNTYLVTMTSIDSYLFWEEDYIPLENEFLNFIKYIPLVEEHNDVWSLKLANQLLLIGSSIDSFFKSTIQCCLDDSHADFGYYSNKNKMNMSIFREIFEPYYKLSEKTVYILRTKEKIKPFEEWKFKKSPEWWRAYTELKHDKFKNKKKAKLKTVLNALAALFLLNIYHLENRQYLININIINDLSNIDNLGVNLDAFDKVFNSKGFIDENLILTAKTKILGYVFETRSSKGKDPWKILCPRNKLEAFDLIDWDD